MFLFANPPDENTLATLLRDYGGLMLKVVLVLIVLLLLVAAVVAIVWWRKRKSPPASAVDPSQAGSAPGAQVTSNQLRDAWNRFTKQLPGDYARSILNFEHFIVLGGSSAGKSTLIDGYSDWRRQAKQLPGTQSHDADLPAYMASGTVITELPARFLTDHSLRCQTALKNLWKPLYKHRAPTVVLVLDTEWLKQSTPETLTEQAESVRAKLNILSGIRGKPIEVRVVLSKLEVLPGFAEFAKFTKDQGIALRMDPTFGETVAPLPVQIERWFESLRDHLPRALLKNSAPDYLKIVAFLRAMPELVAPLSRYVTTLHAPMVLSKTPSAGGIFLCARSAGVSNPLERATERGPGPDPRRNHLLGTVLVASACIAYLLCAYRIQRSLYEPAQHDLDTYDASSIGSDAELKKRRNVCEFTSRDLSFLESHPDFFSSARSELRRRFSEKVRDHLIIPRLRLVAQRGVTDDSPLSLPTRRSLYFLALIHSDKSDPFKILQAEHLGIWEKMTGLSRFLIEDYIRNTDKAPTTPVQFEMNTSDVELRQNWQVWSQFLRETEDANNVGAIKPKDLQELRTRAVLLAKMLEKYEHDEHTVALYNELVVTSPLAELKHDYERKFESFVAAAKAYPVQSNRRNLQAVLQQVRAGAIDSQGQSMLRSLVDGLSLLYDTSGTAGEDEPVKIALGGIDYTFDPRKWRGMLRDSSGREMILQFVRTASTVPSIFFGAEQDAELRPVVWNPTNDGQNIFTGKSVLEPRYTKVAYDNHVRAVVLKLTEVVEKAKLPDDEKRLLTDFVRDRVRRYSGEYRSQVVNFVQGYGLRTLSQEALRVALTQMATPEASAFNDYLNAVHTNTRLDFTDNALLEPMREVVFDFAIWHNVVEGEGGTPEITKYRAVIQQLLTDLGPAEGAAALDIPGQPMTLERAVTPAGKLVLGEVKGEKGAYTQLVTQWLSSVRLPEYQRRAFIAPLNELTRIGRRDVELVMARAWENEALPEVRRIASRFPFDAGANEDATPAEITAVFHPQQGKFFDVFRRYFEPISDFGNGSSFRAKPTVRGRLTLPPHLYELTNSVAALASHLWDPSGKPMNLGVRVATKPFEHGRNPKTALTLVYLNVGSNSIFNFNQKATEINLPIEWTKETTSQVGLQLTDSDTRENIFPDPIVSEGSYWSFMRLMRKAQADPIKYPASAYMYTWTIKVVRSTTETYKAQFVAVDDLWALFSVGNFVRAKLAAAPIAPIQ